MKKAKIILLFSLLFLCNTMYSQTENQDFFRAIGKIYVVVAVIIAIFLGIVIFLIYLDRKLTKLEKQINNK